MYAVIDPGPEKVNDKIEIGCRGLPVMLKLSSVAAANPHPPIIGSRER